MEQVLKTDYPIYIPKKRERKSIIETWAPSNQKKNFYRAIGALIAFIIIILIIVLIIYLLKKKSTCKNVFCKVVQNVQEQINSKVIVK